MVSRVLDGCRRGHRPVASVAEECGQRIGNGVCRWNGLRDEMDTSHLYCEYGEAGLTDKSSKPEVLRPLFRCTLRLDRARTAWVSPDLMHVDHVENMVEYRMSALRIANQLKLARSTVSGVLQRERII